MSADLDSKQPYSDPLHFAPPAEDEEGIVLKRNWTAEEERAAKKKLDLLVMPIMLLGFFCLQLDRGNISNALTDGFLKNVGVTQDQFNVGQQMLSLGIVLTEIPSNMILYKVGPGRWLTLQLFLFGTVSIFQAFQKGYAALLVTRFLLGITESGFIPGGLFYIGTWYTRTETAKRVMIFYFGNQIGQASSKLLAYGILQMRGVGGKSGWFWLFVLMGAFTVASGFVFGFCLPDSFQRPRSTFLPKKTWFTEREIEILRTRVMIDDPAKGKKKAHIPLASFKQAFSNWRLWIHVLISMSNNTPQRGFDTYAPTLVTQFGFPALSANALAAVGLFLQVPVSFCFSYFSDRYNRRGETVMLGLFCGMLGYVFNRSFTEFNGKRGAKYFGVVWTQTFGTFPHPLNIAWMSLACRNSEERALAMAMVIMGANTAGIAGSQIYRSDDRPKYRRAFTIGIAVLAFGVTMALVRFIDDLRRKRRSQVEERTSGTVNSEDSGDEERVIDRKEKEARY